VREDEEAELRRLEHRSPGDGEVDAGGGALTVAPPVRAEAGTFLQGCVRSSYENYERFSASREQCSRFPGMADFRESSYHAKTIKSGLGYQYHTTHASIQV